jgi:hypothetical protein
MTVQTGENQKRKKRKSPDGVATNKLVQSAAFGTNDDLFPDHLQWAVCPTWLPDGSSGIAKMLFVRRLPEVNP